MQGECKGKQPKPRGTEMRMGIHLGLHDSCVDTPSPNSGTPRWHCAGTPGEGAPSRQLRVGRDAERAAGRDCHRHKENAHGHLDSVLRDAVCVPPLGTRPNTRRPMVRSARWDGRRKAQGRKARNVQVLPSLFFFDWKRHGRDQESLWLAVSLGEGESHSRLGGQGVRARGGDSSEGAGCVRERRMYAGWAATAWHPRAGPAPIRATRRARVAQGGAGWCRGTVLRTRGGGGARRGGQRVQGHLGERCRRLSR